MKHLACHEEGRIRERQSTSRDQTGHNVARKDTVCARQAAVVPFRTAAIHGDTGTFRAAAQRMANRLIVAVLFLLGACGDSGSICTVVANADGSATIRCDDGTEATVPPGEMGVDGTSCTVRDGDPGTRIIECDDGTTVTVSDGPEGPEGPPGRNPNAAGRGLEIEVLDAGVGADRRPFVELRLTDADSLPLDRAGVFTRGEVITRFTVAHLPVETRVDGDVVLPYVSYLTETVTSADGPETAEQPVTDSAGTWSALDEADGVFRYDFEAVLPADYPMTETHMIGIYATRTVDDVRYVANATPTFRPDGADVTVTREIVSNEACNSCHSPLAAHGGAREDIQLCISCHGAGYGDPESGNTIDFRTMVHRIHRGASLPSVENGEEYAIVGFRGSVHDYSEVHFPRDIRGCETCHQGTDAERWNTAPSRAACGSCHDDIWFEPGDPPEPWMRLHPGGDRPDDDRCTVCHEPTGGLSPIIDNHFTRLELPDALDVDFTIDAVRLSAGTPVIDFTITIDGVGEDIIASPLPRFSFTVAGPTSEYAFFATYSPSSVGTLTARDASAGEFSYTLPDTIAGIASANAIAAEGTWAFGVEGYATSPSGEPYSMPNAIEYLAITDPTPVPRRQVVDASRCNSCHEELAMHGGPRNDPMYCAMCHNPNTDTIGRMPLPAAGETATTESVSFAHMVHRIHTGHDGVSEYTLWSFGGSPVVFDELHYPADTQVCSRCHVDDESHDIPLSDSALPARTRTIDSTGSIVETAFLPPVTSACVGCHDSDAERAHADTMTDALGVEACATCHSSGSAFGIEEVHSRPEFEFR